MSRFITSFAFAVGCVAMTVHAQDTTVKSTTKSSGGEVKTVTYIGCVHTGTEARSYVLDKVGPVSRTTTNDATGTTSTTTTYMLIPGERVEVQQLVGHKVEVTGMLVPAGKAKTETTTKVDREHGKDTTTREKSSTNLETPQFRVTSIKSVGESCD